LDNSLSFLICGREVVERFGNRKVGNYFDNLKEVVESDDRLEDHEEALRYVKDILQRSCYFRLEVLHTIIANIADCAASERGEG
jgi:hypothetical protein